MFAKSRFAKAPAVFAALVITAFAVFSQVSHAQSTTIPKGVQADPCRVTIPYELRFANDFGEFCRYQYTNATLPAATDHRVVYFGDSITQGWGTGIVGIANDDVINRGVGGQTTPQLLVRFRADVLKLNPRIVHILAGTNDIAGNSGPTSVARIQDAIASMADLAKANGVRVILGSILPAKRYGWAPTINPVPSIAAINVWMKGFAAAEGHVYADYFSAMDDGAGGLRSDLGQDGIHPNALGYSLMEAIARDAIARANR